MSARAKVVIAVLFLFELNPHSTSVRLRTQTHNHNYNQTHARARTQERTTTVTIKHTNTRARLKRTSTVTTKHTSKQTNTQASARTLVGGKCSLRIAEQMCRCKGNPQQKAACWSFEASRGFGNAGWRKIRESSVKVDGPSRRGSRVRVLLFVRRSLGFQADYGIVLRVLLV